MSQDLPVPVLRIRKLNVYQLACLRSAITNYGGPSAFALRPEVITWARSIARTGFELIAMMRIMPNPPYSREIQNDLERLGLSLNIQIRSASCAGSFTSAPESTPSQHNAAPILAGRVCFY